MKNSGKKKKITVSVVISITAVILTVIIMSISPAKEISSSADSSTSNRRPVSVASVMPSSYPAVITSLGEAYSLWESVLKTEADGRITFISDSFRKGNIVRKDEILLETEKSSFLLQLAVSRSHLARAEFGFLTAEREALEAEKNWKNSGIEGLPSSPLVLKKPQLKIAAFELEEAKASVDNAERMLANTDVKAPFDGVVLERYVNPGETLQPGSEIARLYCMETMEISIHLDMKNRALCRENLTESEVRIIDPEQNASWSGSIVRESRSLKRDSRLQTLYLSVDKPLEKNPPLLPGTFVKVEITGREIDSVIRLPESTLTREGYIWFADPENRLRSFRTDPLFYSRGMIYIKAPEDIVYPANFIINPNSSFLNGLEVSPVVKKITEEDI